MKRSHFGYLVLGLCVALAVPAAAQIEVVSPGKVVTGFNRYLDQPYLDFGPPLGLANFSAVEVFNPNGANPLPLTTRTPDDALLATFLDPNFLGLVGLDPSQVDPALVNVPLRDVAVNVGFAGQTRIPLPGSLRVDAVDPSQVSPANPIDLSQWNEARGSISITCLENGTADFALYARNLLPNRLYSVWGNYFRPDLLPAPPIQAHAIGGVPNAFVSSANGRGSFERTLVGCPLFPDDLGRQLLAIDLIFHSDHQLVGAVPSTPLAGGGLGQGAVSHPHLAFLIAGTPLLEPEGWGDSGVCLPGQTIHCFQDARFLVAIEWSDFDGNVGSGRTADFEYDDSGTFYFFNPDNRELLVKVLDGCAINDHFWVFAAAATNVEYTLTVIDTQTREEQTYTNRLGTRSPAIADTTAFATCP